MADSAPKHVSSCSLSAPGGGEGRGESLPRTRSGVGDSREPAVLASGKTHLTFPSLRDGPLPLPPEGWRGELNVDVGIEFERWEDDCPGAAALAEIAAVAALTEATAVGFSLDAELTLGITLTDDSQQRDLNRSYRGKDSSTNVLSFALSDSETPLPPGAPVLLGDVVLAFETVAREAQEQEKPLADHLQHLVVHGVLHLLGFDHEDDADAALMEAREVEILQSLGVPDPYRDTM